MKHYSEEELERALLALPLEETPAGMRAAILAATAYEAPAMIARWELAGLISVAFAITTLAWMIAAGGAPLFTRTLLSLSLAVDGALSNVQVLIWLAAGCATAFALSLSLNAPAPIRERIAKR